MSGYLQRMAAGLMHPTHALHPVVGTIWAAPHADRAIETSDQITATSNTDRFEPRTEAPALFSRRVASEALPGSKFHSQSVRTLQSSRLRQPAPESDQRDLSNTPGVTASSPTGDVTVAEMDASRVFEPLLADFIHEQQAATSPQMFEREGSRRRDGLARPQPGTQSGQHDDIEIHIGRIEITAALPQPAPLPARPTRKSLDLGEYLKRDRRSR